MGEWDVYQSAFSVLLLDYASFHSIMIAYYWSYFWTSDRESGIRFLCWMQWLRMNNGCCWVKCRTGCPFPGQGERKSRLVLTSRMKNRVSWINGYRRREYDEDDYCMLKHIIVITVVNCRSSFTFCFLSHANAFLNQGWVCSGQEVFVFSFIFFMSFHVMPPFHSSLAITSLRFRYNNLSFFFFTGINPIMLWIHYFSLPSIPLIKRKILWWRRQEGRKMDQE